MHIILLRMTEIENTCLNFLSFTRRLRFGTACLVMLNDFAHCFAAEVVLGQEFVMWCWRGQLQTWGDETLQLIIHLLTFGSLLHHFPSSVCSLPNYRGSWSFLPSRTSQVRFRPISSCPLQPSKLCAYKISLTGSMSPSFNLSHVSRDANKPEVILFSSKLYFFSVTDSYAVSYTSAPFLRQQFSLPITFSNNLNLIIWSRECHALLKLINNRQITWLHFFLLSFKRKVKWF